VLLFKTGSRTFKNLESCSAGVLVSGVRIAACTHASSCWHRLSTCALLRRTPSFIRLNVLGKSTGMPAPWSEGGERDVGKRGAIEFPGSGGPIDHVILS